MLLSKSAMDGDLPFNDILDIGDGIADPIVGEVYDHVERHLEPVPS